MGLEDKIPSSVQTRNLSKQILGSREDMPEYQLYMLYSQVDATGKNPETGARGIRNERYTYAVRFKEGEITGEYLFDRKHDPYQINNLANSERLWYKCWRMRKILHMLFSPDNHKKDQMIIKKRTVPIRRRSSELI